MEKVRIQDDLFQYVNGEWIENAVIPDDKPTAGGFSDLATDVEKLMIGEFNEMSASGNYSDKYLEQACKLYKIAKDVKKRNKDGIKPVAKSLAKIKKMADISAFNRNLFDFLMNGTAPLPFDMDVMTDMMDSKHHAIGFSGPQTILPDASYYKPGMEQQKQMMLGLWSQIAKQILAKTDLTAEEQDKYIADTLAFDAVIASLVKTQEEWSEYVKAYNPMKTSKVCSMMKPVKFKALLVKIYGFVPEQIIVGDPRFLKGFKQLFNAETFEQYRSWAYVTGLIGACSLLSEELRDLGSAFRRQLMGGVALSSVEKFAYNLSSAQFSEPVGLYYGKKYFGEEAKKDVIEMVMEIIETYKSRIKNNDFLSDATKEKAVLKLSTMGVKMGFPDKVEEIYDSYIVDEKASLLANMQKFAAIKRAENFAELTKDVDLTKWPMPGHMVNACYNPMRNDITFPAAILQAPFYSIKQTRSQNLGGIGAVIGHEISHAFDNNGAKCDENGNLKNWWTKEDFKKFEKKTKAMINEFEGIELPWGKVNAKFIVSENIADNGGMAVTLEIMGKMAEKSYEEYFMNWARVWCMKAREDYLKLLLQVDVHGPAILRANMQPRNFTEWYDTFKVKKTDKMYIAPAKRVTIW